MSLLAQHGYGKGSKIDLALQQGSVDGLVMSPRDESPANLAAYLERVRAT